MSEPDVAIAGFYDHDQEDERRAPDWGGDDLFTAGPPRRRRFERAEHAQYAVSHHQARLRETGEHPLPAAPEPPEPHHADRYLEPVPAGRRTVTITGRPQSTAIARRPARTLDERIAQRPERIASWTIAMGVLMVVLAIVTAH